MAIIRTGCFHGSVRPIEEARMVDVEKTTAVREYLQAEFPDCRIEEGHDVDGHTFQIGFEGSTYIVIVTDEFLRDHDRPDIGKALSRHTLIEHLRDLPNTPVVVTNSGLKLQYD
jgi:hypothetical protein